MSEPCSQSPFPRAVRLNSKATVHRQNRAVNMAFVTAAALPRSGLSHASTAVCARPAAVAPVLVAPFEIQAAKHCQFKATKKANRYRPRKHRPSDRNRKPPPYNTEPLRAEGFV